MITVSTILCFPKGRQLKMIPKIIHYCWFGRNPMPELAMRCIASWKRYCPDYQIIEWNESNIAINDCPAYVQDAYKEGLWAFVSDYVRLKVVYEHGGIYLDTDVELIKPLDNLLVYNAFFGFEAASQINTGLGFGAVAKTALINDMMADYQTMSFYNPDGSINYTTCPDINTHVFLRHGLKQNNKKQILNDNILILPTEYLCPINYHTDMLRKTSRTISIHWFSKSWMTAESKKLHQERAKEVIRDYWIHLPNRILRLLIGQTAYEALKNALKRRKK